MKLKKLFIGLVAASLTISNLPASAQSKRFVYEGGRDMGVWRVYLLNKKLVKKDGGDLYYLANFETKTTSEYRNYKNTEVNTNLVKCSKLQPFITFKVDDLAIINYVKPQGDPGSINNHNLALQYWAVCHNLFNEHEDLESKAKQLGYDGEFKDDQIQVPYLLIQYIK